MTRLLTVHKVILLSPVYFKEYNWLYNCTKTMYNSINEENTLKAVKVVIVGIGLYKPLELGRFDRPLV